MAAFRAPSSLSDAADEILADRAGDGDLRAFEVLMRRHTPLLRVTTRRILGSSADVDDIVQDTFLTAWRQLPGLENSKAVKGWLLRIASRKSIDRIRARHEHDDIDDHADNLEDTAPKPEHVSEANSRQAALSEALSRLPEDQRRAWVLRELSQYSYEDIAQDLGVPTTTVRGLLVRARKNLMREMEAWR